MPTYCINVYVTPRSWVIAGYGQGRDGKKCGKQCCGSVSFWTDFWIRIRNYLYGSGSRSFHEQAKKLKKPISTVS
jgi:hypothetical protein